MALALGLIPSEVEQMPASDYSLLERYWLHEPWGAWRDNLHTAIIAAEVRRPHLKQGAKQSLDAFMLRHPDEIAEQQQAKRQQAARSLFESLRSIAKKRPRNG